MNRWGRLCLLVILAVPMCSSSQELNNNIQPPDHTAIDQVLKQALQKAFADQQFQEKMVGLMLQVGQSTEQSKHDMECLTDGRFEIVSNASEGGFIWFVLKIEGSGLVARYGVNSAGQQIFQIIRLTRPIPRPNYAPVLV